MRYRRRQHIVLVNVRCILPAPLTCLLPPESCGLAGRDRAAPGAASALARLEDLLHRGDHRLQGAASPAALQCPHHHSGRPGGCRAEELHCVHILLKTSALCNVCRASVYSE